jgi:hypothetical protein
MADCFHATDEKLMFFFTLFWFRVPIAIKAKIIPKQ